MYISSLLLNEIKLSLVVIALTPLACIYGNNISNKSTIPNPQSVSLSSGIII